MSLQQQLSRIRGYLTDANPHPSNEANTCNRVITPLLLQCGYDYHEIDVQSHDAAGRYPDYTILPNTPHTWFLEVKAWQEMLADTHVIQALNYAHTRGKRWVVLSNGKEWRLYDDFIVGVEPADRLITVARLERSEEIEPLLCAISKDSVCSGALEKYALHIRLSTILKQQLLVPHSEINRAITGILRNKLGLRSVGSGDVAAYFHATFNASSPTDVIEPRAVSAPSSAVATSEGYTLSDLMLQARTIQGRKPQSLILPDQTKKLISSWREVAQNVIEWLFLANKIPTLPFSGQQRGRRYFICALRPTTEDTDKHYKTLTTNGMTIYIHVNRSAPDFVICLNALCKEVRESPEGFIVTLR